MLWESRWWMMCLFGTKFTTNGFKWRKQKLIRMVVIDEKALEDGQRECVWLCGQVSAQACGVENNRIARGFARNSDNRTKFYRLSNFLVAARHSRHNTHILNGNIVKCTWSHQKVLRQISTLRRSKNHQGIYFSSTNATPRNVAHWHLLLVLSTVSMHKDIHQRSTASSLSSTVTKINLGL